MSCNVDPDFVHAVGPVGGIDDLGRGVERGIAELAGRQHGVVTRGQLLELGLGAGAIDHRVRKGWLSVIHRGVYLVGHGAPTPRSREIAAVLACGPTAVLSHRGAASFWKLLPYLPNSAPISVTVRNRNIDPKPGITVHRSPSLPRRDYTIRDEIPVTSPARTILDLAAVASGRDVERAIAEGYAERIVSERQLLDQLERSPGRPGTRLLRDVLGADGVAPTRSDAERLMLRLIRNADLPVPEVNAILDGYEVDFLWRDRSLVVEVDGFATHSARESFEADRVRDARLAACGYTVVRISWRELTGRPEAVAARLAAALAVRGVVATTAPVEGTAGGGE